VVSWFKKLYGDGYYLEVQRFPELERTRHLNPLLAELSSVCGVPLVATADVHHPLPEQNKIREVLHAALRGSTVDKVAAAWEYNIPGAYPISDEEVDTALRGTGLTADESWSAILSSQEIGERCQVTLPKSELVRYPGTAKELTW
jgi:DNA polymerase-3 subunit alpha